MECCFELSVNIRNKYKVISRCVSYYEEINKNWPSNTTVLYNINIVLLVFYKIVVSDGHFLFLSLLYMVN